MRLFRLAILLLIFSFAFSQQCHYSCATCTDRYYSHCFTCNSTSQTLVMAAVSNGTQTGICTFPAYVTINYLGVFVLIVTVVAATFLKSQYIIYFLFALQSISLLSLVQVAYPYSLTILLQSFQYFMIFSVMSASNKVSDGVFTYHSMYRLNNFFQTVSFDANAPPIISLIIIAGILLGGLSIFRAFRQNCCKIISENSIKHMLVGLRTFLILTMQEMLLIIYISIRFDSLKGGNIFLILVYLIILVYLFVDCNLHSLPYFKSPETMNLIFLKRMFLPVLVMIPYLFTYNLIIFMVGFAIIELLFLIKAQSKTKIYIYTLLQLCCYTAIGSFAIVELQNNNRNQSYLASLISTILLSLYCGGLFLEVLIAVKRRFFMSKIQNNDEWEAKISKNSNTALRDQDTLADQHQGNHMETTQEPKIIRTTNKQEDNKVPNLLNVTKRQQKKFKVHKVDKTN